MDRADYVNQAEGRNQQDLYIHSGNVSVDRDTMTNGLRELFPERYQRIDAIKSGRTEQERTARLFKSEGTKLSQQGTYVLELSTAGSSYFTFRSEHKGFNGKVEGKDKLKDAAPDLEERIEQHLGHRVGPAEAKYTFKKDTIINGRTMKTKFSIGGCGSEKGGGASNSGYYSIDENRKHILDITKRQLEPLFQAWKEGRTDVPQNTELMFRGHSRGAVATGQGAMLVNAWIAKEYPQFRDRVHFNVVLLDPVPGLFSNDDLNVKMDFLHPTEAMIKEGMDTPLRPTDDTTVFMSGTMELESMVHNFGVFNPQNVSGAKRVIVSRNKHSIYLHDYDGSQRDGDHFVAFTDENGDAYRSYGISKLKPGVYFADQDYNLIHMEKMEEIDKAFDKAFPNDGILAASNKSRKQILRGMAKDGVLRQMMESRNVPGVLEEFQHEMSRNNGLTIQLTPEQKESVRARLRERSSLASRRMMPSLLQKFKDTEAWYVRSTPLYKKMVESIKAVKNSTNPVDIIKYKRALNELKENTTAYLEYKKDNLNGDRANTRYNLAANLLDYTNKCQEELNTILENARRPQRAEAVERQEAVAGPEAAERQEAVAGHGDAAGYNAAGPDAADGPDIAGRGDAAGPDAAGRQGRQADEGPVFGM